jgi:hypothetical protein
MAMRSQPAKGDVLHMARGEWQQQQKSAARLHLKLGRSATAGFGLFAATEIPQDILIVEYVGLVRPSDHWYPCLRAPDVGVNSSVSCLEYGSALS